MALLLVALLIALLFGGLGFAIHILWIVAIVFALAWAAGLGFRRGRGRLWHRW
jgi:Na+/H+ antiporter NhaC